MASSSTKWHYDVGLILNLSFLKIFFTTKIKWIDLKLFHSYGLN